MQELNLDIEVVHKIMEIVSREYVEAEEVAKMQSAIVDQEERLKTMGKQEEAFKAELDKAVRSREEAVAAHEQEVLGLRKGISLDKELTLAGARNHKAVTAFLTEFLGQAKVEGGSVVGLAEEVARLKQDAETAFLFAGEPAKEASPTPQLVGFKAGESSGVVSPTVNPFAKETFNPQAQVELFRSNPAEARALALKAGLTLG